MTQREFAAAPNHHYKTLTLANPHKLIDGRALAEKVYAELRGEIALLKASGTTPGLAVVLVGDDPASRAYVRSKDKMCRELELRGVEPRSRNPWHSRPVTAPQTNR